MNNRITENIIDIGAGSKLYYESYEKLESRTKRTNPSRGIKKNKRRYCQFNLLL